MGWLTEYWGVPYPEFTALSIIAVKEVCSYLPRIHPVFEASAVLFMCPSTQVCIRAILRAL